MTLSQQLKKWRGATKQNPRGEMTQADAAAKLGVSLRTYQNWEQGHRAPSGIALQAILERIK